MLHAIIATDYPDTVEKRRHVRPRHMEYIMKDGVFQAVVIKRFNRVYL